MVDFASESKWRERGLKVLSAVVVVTSYLLVLAGLLAIMTGDGP